MHDPQKFTPHEFSWCPWVSVDTCHFAINQCNLFILLYLLMNINVSSKLSWSIKMQNLIKHGWASMNSESSGWHRMRYSIILSSVFICLIWLPSPTQSTSPLLCTVHGPPASESFGSEGVVLIRKGQRLTPDLLIELHAGETLASSF